MRSGEACPVSAWGFKYSEEKVEWSGEEPPNSKSAISWYVEASKPNQGFFREENRPLKLDKRPKEKKVRETSQRRETEKILDLLEEIAK